MEEKLKWWRPAEHNKLLLRLFRQAEVHPSMCFNNWKSFKNDNKTHIYVFLRTTQRTFDPRSVVTTARLVIKRQLGSLAGGLVDRSPRMSKKAAVWPFVLDVLLVTANTQELMDHCTARLSVELCGLHTGHA
jgi:hypothetical protein